MLYLAEMSFTEWQSSIKYSGASSGVATPGQLRALPGLQIFLPGLRRPKTFWNKIVNYFLFIYSICYVNLFSYLVFTNYNYLLKSVKNNNKNSEYWPQRILGRAKLVVVCYFPDLLWPNTVNKAAKDSG